MTYHFNLVILLVIGKLSQNMNFYKVKKIRMVVQAITLTY